MTMTSLPWLLMAASLGAIGVGLLVPGPAMVSTMLATTSGGYRRGLAHSAGIVAGSAVWAACAAAAVASAVSIDRHLFALLLAAGGAYLFIVAIFLAGASTAAPAEAEAMPGRRIASAYWCGFMLQISNPKAVLTWAAAIAISASPGGHAAVPLLVGVAGVALEAGFYAALVAAFSRGAMVTGYRRRKRLFDALAAAVLGLSGLWLLNSAYRTAAASGAARSAECLSWHEGVRHQ